LRAKELNPDINPVMLVADRFPNFSICGLPYYISKEVKDWRNLAHRTKQDIENEGVKLLLEHTAKVIDPGRKQVVVVEKKVYYPPVEKLLIRVTADRDTRKLLGAQMLGAYRTEVSKRIDIFAAALYHGLTLELFSDYDLSYTPPLSNPWDPVQMAVQNLEKRLRMTRMIINVSESKGTTDY
jgi:NADPH-dependent 2,4-dienoyl-CoA reductase/sulfur reductase-like enzyme